MPDLVRPIIILSTGAHWRVLGCDRARAAQAAAYLDNPVSPEGTLKVVRDCLMHGVALYVEQPATPSVRAFWSTPSPQHVVAVTCRPYDA